MWQGLGPSHRNTILQGRADPQLGRDAMCWGLGHQTISYQLLALLCASCAFRGMTDAFQGLNFFLGKMQIMHNESPV